MGKVALELDQIAAPIVSQFDPPIGMLMSGIAGAFQNRIVQAEQNIPAAQSGPQKLAATKDAITSDLATAASTLNVGGYSFDETLMQKAISDQVTAFNSIAAFKASIKVSP